jgi:hypothetical protein
LHDLIAVTRLLGQKQERGGADVSTACLVTSVPASVAVAAERRSREVVRVSLSVQLAPAAMMPRPARAFKMIFVYQSNSFVRVSVTVYNDISRYVACQT